MVFVFGLGSGRTFLNNIREKVALRMCIRWSGCFSIRPRAVGGLN